MTKETTGLQRYLTYIDDRITYLRVVTAGIPSNEYEYCKALRERIKQWGSTHILCYSYIRGKIDMTRVIHAMGVSERVCYRMISKQRNELIKFITEQEKILEEQYPHIAEVDE
jgi:hypothetical protein